MCVCDRAALTFGAHSMCMLGTGRVVMYMVTIRYKYNIPCRKKNLRPTMALSTQREQEESWDGVSIQRLYLHTSNAFGSLLEQCTESRNATNLT